MLPAELDPPLDPGPDLFTVTRIDSLDDPGDLAASWDELHRRDPRSTVFTSRAWLGARLSTLDDPWWLLAARASADGTLAGLLALRRATPADPIAGTILTLAGSPLADYTGLLCLPGRESEVAAALARHLDRRLPWRRLEIRDTRDPRLALLLEHFRPPRFRIDCRPPTPCPRLELAPEWLAADGDDGDYGDDGWNGYLGARVRPRMRETIRRKLRAIGRLPAYRRTRVEDEGERQIDTIVELWRQRWGPLPDARLEQHRAVFRSCLAAGSLWGDVLWDGDVPIAGLLAYLEPARGAFRYYVSGFDERYAALSPGLVIVAHSIREAIRGGYRTYDFLRGDEPYKLSFGARPEHSENFDVVRLDPED